MQRSYFRARYFAPPDILILLLIAAVIYGVISIGNEYRADFHPLTQIDLSPWALPRYTLLSGMRGTVAYLMSLAFTLVVGYVAAKSKRAEQIIIPMLDILQCIPVLGFLPGVALGLIALFPKTNTGLELSALLLIFTGQVWNMTFSYYSSLKSIPADFVEASTIMGLSWWQKLMKVELPFSAVNLAWNSLLSMAGGWFFLSVCEAFTLGDREYRLPGIGAYMMVAINEGNTKAMVLGVIAMVALIVGMDFLIWRPILSWVQRFRIEEVPGAAGSVEPLMKIVIRESRLVRWFKVVYHRFSAPKRHPPKPDPQKSAPKSIELSDLVSGANIWWTKLSKMTDKRESPLLMTAIEMFALGLASGLILLGAWKLMGVLHSVAATTWALIFRNTLWTLT